MLAVGVFCCVALIYWTRLSALDISHGQQLIPGMTGSPLALSSTEAADGLETQTRVPHLAPCFVDNIFAALHESVGNNDEITSHTLTVFGVCTLSGNSSSSLILSELVADVNRNQRVRMADFHPVGVRLSEEDPRGSLKLTFGLPQSLVLKPNPVLVLAFESPLAGGNLEATFTGQALQPHTQSACISGETRYVILTGNLAEDNADHKWRITVDTEAPDMKQPLKDIFIGGKSGRYIGITPLLFFQGRQGTDMRYASVPSSFLASSQTSSFLCELKRFLGDVMPEDRPETLPLRLTSLQSPSPLLIGLSSSEALLSGLINSSSLSFFSFSSCCSVFQAHVGELALPAALLEELRLRLEQTVVQIMEVIKQEELGHRGTERLGRLMELSAFSKVEPLAGDRQYRAFLLLKALQTMARMFEAKRGLRAARADPNNPVLVNQCGLRSLTVSLEKHAIGPNTANIYNCHGACAVPLVNPTNHAVLLNSHIESERAANENVDERPPCCVPLTYEDIYMVLLNPHGTGTELKCLKDVVAKECGCR
ncbi:muellerian-inhibiting factor [Brachionichthys hirsutus]|uniref:muellerian-inhibiting factor n=1 Tax=Brachionichthys hirsutus TaxID=412623 RepID=UPI0036045E93